MIYGLTAFRAPINYADSDDLSLAAYYGGLAHPPGYPLLVWLIYPWIKFFPPQQTATWVNLTSSIFTAGTAVLIYAASLSLLKHVFPLKFKTKELIWPALLAALSYGTWSTTWWHARVMEVFPLAQFLAMGYVWLTLRQNQAAKQTRVWLWFTGLVGMIAIGYHPLNGLLVVPTFIYGWYATEEKRKYLGMIMLGAFTGVMVNFGLYWFLPAAEARYSWPMEKTFKGILRFYGRFDYTDDGSAVEAYVKEIDLIHSVKSVFIWLTNWIKETYIVGLLIAAVGALVLFKQSRREFWWLLAIIIISGSGLTAYHKYPIETKVNEITLFWGTVLRWRLQFVCALPIALLTGFGWHRLIQWSGSLVLKKKYLFTALIMVGIILMGIGLRHKFWETQTLNIPVQEHSQLVLNSLPQDAILLVDSDAAFNFIYFCLNRVLIVSSQPASRNNYYC